MKEDEILRATSDEIEQKLKDILGYINELEDAGKTLTSADEGAMIKALYVFKKLIKQSNEQNLQKPMAIDQVIERSLVNNMDKFSPFGQVLAQSYLRLQKLNPSTLYRDIAISSDAGNLLMKDTLAAGEFFFFIHQSSFNHGGWSCERERKSNYIDIIY